jgi:hypothetical protein
VGGGNQGGRWRVEVRETKVEGGKRNAEDCIETQKLDVIKVEGEQNSFHLPPSTFSSPRLLI